MRPLLFLPLLLVSCTMPSTLRNPETGEWITLGGSLGTRTEKESAMAVSASGTMISYQNVGKDETAIAKYYALWQATGELATAARQAYQSAGITRRALGAQGVQRARIRSIEAIKLKELENVVPEATLLPVMP